MARGRRAEAKSHIRCLQKTGKYTYYVTIPKKAIDEIGWRTRQKVVVRRVGKRFIIEDWKRGSKK